MLAREGRPQVSMWESGVCECVGKVDGWIHALHRGSVLLFYSPRDRYILQSEMGGKGKAKSCASGLQPPRSVTPGFPSGSSLMCVDGGNMPC